MLLRFSKDWLHLAVLLLVVITSAMDLYIDLAHGASVSHIIKESIIVLLAAMVIIWLFNEQRQQRREIHHLQTALVQKTEVSESMSDAVRKIRRELSEVISQQFSQWQLTRSESEVGWLLLKGLSLKEIAVIRDTLEKTVRQQASSIYRKAGLSGRHAFSAWFIEDLL